MYICWSFDGTDVPIQQIVVMRSRDGGKTWGGITPGDNIPFPVSQKTLISGIGCHIAIGPKGEVYATWYDNQLNALMQAKSNNRGALWSLAVPIAGIAGVNAPFPGEAFRNLSIPTTAVDGNGTVYVAARRSTRRATRCSATCPRSARQIKSGGISIEGLQALLVGQEGQQPRGRRATRPAATGSARCRARTSCSSSRPTAGARTRDRCASTRTRATATPTSSSRGWRSPTSGQVNISFFDRRNDPANYFIDTYLARSEDGGATFTDRRASQRMWDPAVNAPTSVSGKFIGDYQGLVADDNLAIPFWNDTQLNNLPASDPEHSPYQEVFAARIPQGPDEAESRCRRAASRKSLKVGSTSIGRLDAARARATAVGRRLGPPGRTARGVLRYCVKGGGSVLAAFTTTSRVGFAATTAQGPQALGHRPRQRR